MKQVKDIKKQIKNAIKEASDNGAFNWQILDAIMQAIVETPELLDVKSSTVDIKDGIAVFQVFSEKRNEEIKKYKELFTDSDVKSKIIKFDRNIH